MNIRFSSILSFLLLWAALPCAAQVFESDTTSIYEERLQLLEEFAKEDSMLVRNKVGVAAKLVPQHIEQLATTASSPLSISSRRLGERHCQARPITGRTNKE